MNRFPGPLVGVHRNIRTFRNVHRNRPTKPCFEPTTAAINEAKACRTCLDGESRPLVAHLGMPCGLRIASQKPQAPAASPLAKRRKASSAQRAGRFRPSLRRSGVSPEGPGALLEPCACRAKQSKPWPLSPKGKGPLCAAAQAAGPLWGGEQRLGPWRPLLGLFGFAFGEVQGRKGSVHIEEWVREANSTLEKPALWLRLCLAASPLPPFAKGEMPKRGEVGKAEAPVGDAKG